MWIYNSHWSPVTSAAACTAQIDHMTQEPSLVLTLCIMIICDRCANSTEYVNHALYNFNLLQDCFGLLLYWKQLVKKGKLSKWVAFYDALDKSSL